jgi:hypothetical protein
MRCKKHLAQTRIVRLQAIGLHRVGQAGAVVAHRIAKRAHARQ